MKITKIAQQVKNRGRYSLYVDGEYAFSLSETALLESGLNVGVELSKERLDELKTESATDKVFAMTLGLIARRPRSKWEIEDYLCRKDVSSEEASKILNKLTNLRFIDDLDFAQRWVENRRLLKNVSKRKLQMELKLKRISAETIAHVLEDDQTDDRDVLKELIQKKRTQTRYQDDVKLAQYLTRQGFRYEDVKKALNDERDLTN